MKREIAETTGLRALEWLVAKEDLLPVFMGATGATPGDLRAGSGDAAFLGSVLDFLLMDDAWIVAFCDAAQLPYDAPMRARLALPGGADTEWG